MNKHILYLVFQKIEDDLVKALTAICASDNMARDKINAARLTLTELEAQLNNDNHTGRYLTLPTNPQPLHLT